VKGWVHVESYTDPPEQLLKYRSWTLRRGPGEPVVRRLAEGREHGSGMVARLEGIEDRDAAGLLQGSSIAVARSEMPPLKEREYYQADLLGLEVVNLEQVALGVLRQFAPTPGGMMMIVQRAGRDIWIPAAPQYLNKVDLQAGRVTVDWPAELK
jgi:16S rRNA processing protein RimM